MSRGNTFLSFVLNLRPKYWNRIPEYRTEEGGGRDRERERDGMEREKIQ